MEFPSNRKLGALGVAVLGAAWLWDRFNTNAADPAPAAAEIEQQGILEQKGVANKAKHLYRSVITELDKAAKQGTPEPNGHP